MSDYEPTPAHGFSALRKKARQCPKCRYIAAGVIPPEWNPLRHFCPACVETFLGRAVPRLIDIPEAPVPAQVPSAKSVTERFDDLMFPSGLEANEFSNAPTVKMDLRAPPRQTVQGVDTPLTDPFEYP